MPLSSRATGPITWPKDAIGNAIRGDYEILRTFPGAELVGLTLHRTIRRSPRQWRQSGTA